MRRRDLASVALKVLGAYFAVLAVVHLATLAFLPSSDLPDAAPGLVYATSAALMVWGTDLCLWLMGFAPPRDDVDDAR